MVKVNLPEADTSSGTHTEYSFENADDFYDTLLNLSDNIDKNLWIYYPAIHGQRRWIFRGHWESGNKLLPCAFRKKKKDGKEWYENFQLNKSLRTEIGPIKTRRPPILNLNKTTFKPIKSKDRLGRQIITECGILEHFMETANSLGIECNYTPSLYECYKKVNEAFRAKDTKELEKWPYDDILPLMSSAQHHGIPTRLLDFSYNPLFAAFFAASRPFFKEYLKGIPEIKPKPSKRLCVWAIQEEPSANIIKEETEDYWKTISAPSSRSSNLFAQEGVLILDPKANQRFLENKKVWQDLQTLTGSKHLIKLTLPQTECKELLSLLWESNITPARVRPNLDSVTQTLEYTQWLWTEK